MSDKQAAERLRQSVECVIRIKSTLCVDNRSWQLLDFAVIAHGPLRAFWEHDDERHAR